MATNTLNILKPSVNNLTVRIFVRAAGLDYEEVDVWGQTTTPEYLSKYPAHLTPMLEEEGLPQGALGGLAARPLLGFAKGPPHRLGNALRPLLEDEIRCSLLQDLDRGLLAEGARDHDERDLPERGRLTGIYPLH